MAHLFEEATPAAVRDAKGLALVTTNTPNGQKTQILLEELQDVYGAKLDWTTTLIDISTNEQKKPWFERLNLNGRIPVLLDHRRSPPFPVFETSAQLLYLCAEFDSQNIFGFKGDELETSEAMQWLAFWHGGGAPYQGQTNHFFHYAKEDVPYAKKRYREETLRVYGVLEDRLSGRFTNSQREYLVGSGKGKYSYVDINVWPWVKAHKYAGFTDEEMSKFPQLLAYIDRIAARPAAKRGIGEKYQPVNGKEIYLTK